MDGNHGACGSDADGEKIIGTSTIQTTRFTESKSKYFLKVKEKITPAKSFLKYVEEPKMTKNTQIDPSEKILPLTQDSQVTNVIKPFTCLTCPRTFTTKSGRTNHSKSCSGNNTKTLSLEASTMQPTKPLTSSSGREDEDVTGKINHVIETPNQTLRKNADMAYQAMSEWRGNIFTLPKGNSGKDYINEMTKLIEEWNSNSPRKDFALKLLMIMPNLLLQQTTFKAKSKVNKETLVRRMQLWKEDKIEDLVDECRVIQSRLKTTTRKDDAHERAERFNKLMMQGNIKAAIRLLSATERGGVLPLNEETMTELKKKHPDAQPQFQQLLLHGPVKQVNPVIFDQIDEGTILQAASKTKGSSGPSMSNADDWRRILVSHQYGNATVDLRKAIATMSRKLCREDNKSPESIEALIACRLIKYFP